MPIRSLRSVCVTALCAVVLFAAPARAHGHLVRSRPAAHDTLTTAPRALTLEFNEAPELSMSAVRLLDSRQHEIRLAPVRVERGAPKVLIADVLDALGPGRYTVRWQIAGRDGHPTHGTFEFVVLGDSLAAAAPATLPAPVVDTAAASRVTPVPSQTHRDVGFDSESLPYVLVRWAQFIGLLTIIGAVAFRWLVLGRAAGPSFPPQLVADAASRARRLAAGGALLLALSAVARLFAQWTALRVDAVAPSAMPLDRVILESTWGHAWLLEVAALVLLAIGLGAARRSSGALTGWRIAAVAAVALSVVPALSGHAAVSGTPVTLLVDVAHVLAAGGWMGTLLVLLAAGLASARALPATSRGPAVASMVNAFSPVALSCAALIVLTGLVAALRNVETMSALTQSRYGNMLLRKLFFLVVAALIGFYNWRRARPALAATGDERAIRRAMRAELLAGVVILLFTAYLVAIPTPADLARP